MIKIYMTGYNSESLIIDAIESIINQTYRDWELQIIIDPLKDSNTFNFAKIYENNKIKILLNDKRKGLMANVITAIDILEPDNEDIIVCVDSDDKLADNNVLQKVVNTYSKNKDLAVCYGGIVFEELDGTLRDIPWFRQYNEVELNNVRHSDWHGTHLRTMKYKIYKNIPDSYKKDDDGNYFTKANDVALMISAIELAGANRVGYFDFPTYIYRPPKTNENYKGLQTVVTNSDITIKEAKSMEAKIKSKTPLKRIKHFNSFSFVLYIKGSEMIPTLEKSIRAVKKNIITEVKELILVELYEGEKFCESVAKKHKYKYVPFDISSKRNPNISTFGRNIGVLASSEDFVIVNDVDLLIDTNFFSNIAEMADKHQYFGTWSEINYQKKNGKGYDKTTMWRDDKFTYANGGSVCFNKEFFIKMGGYDEIYRSWGAEDNDFNFRASIVMGYQAKCIKNNKLIHMWHPSKALAKDDYTRISNNNILYYRMREYLPLINRFID